MTLGRAGGWTGTGTGCIRGVRRGGISKVNRKRVSKEEGPTKSGGPISSQT